MTVVTGKFHHADGTYDLAIAEPDPVTPGSYLTVVSFPESRVRRKSRTTSPPAPGTGSSPPLDIAS